MLLKWKNWITSLRKIQALQRRQQAFSFKLRYPVRENGFIDSLRWNGNPFQSGHTFSEGGILVFPSPNSPEPSSLPPRNVSPDEIQSTILKILKSRGLSSKVTFMTGRFFFSKFIDSLQKSPIIFDSESFSIELGFLEREELVIVASLLCTEFGYSSVLIKDHATNGKSLLVLEEGFSMKKSNKQIFFA